MSKIVRKSDRLSMREWLERIRKAQPISTKISPAQAIRELRGP